MVRVKKCCKSVVDDWEKKRGGYLNDVLARSLVYLFVAYNYFPQRISCQFPLVAMVAILF
jgi:hypothetical protein